MNKQTNPDPETIWMCHDLNAGWLPFAWGASKKNAISRLPPENWPGATAHKVKISKVKTERKEAKQNVRLQDAEQFVGMWLNDARIEWLARNPANNEVVSYARGSKVLLTADVNFHRLRLEYDYENGERQVTKAEIG